MSKYSDERRKRGSVTFNRVDGPGRWLARVTVPPIGMFEGKPIGKKRMVVIKRSLSRLECETALDLYFLPSAIKARFAARQSFLASLACGEGDKIAGKHFSEMEGRKRYHRRADTRPRPPKTIKRRRLGSIRRFKQGWEAFVIYREIGEDPRTKDIYTKKLHRISIIQSDSRLECETMLDLYFLPKHIESRNIERVDRLGPVVLLENMPGDKKLFKVYDSRIHKA